MRACGWPVLLRELGPNFFDYKFEVVFEFEWESSKLTLNKQLFNEPKLIQLKKTLDHFIQTMILSDLPVLPEEKDVFFSPITWSILI